MKKIKAAAEITQVSVDKIGGEEQGANARASPEGDGTGNAARRSEKVCLFEKLASHVHCMLHTDAQHYIVGALHLYATHRCIAYCITGALHGEK